MIYTHMFNTQERSCDTIPCILEQCNILLISEVYAAKVSKTKESGINRKAQKFP